MGKEGLVVYFWKKNTAKYSVTNHNIIYSSDEIT